MKILIGLGGGNNSDVKVIRGYNDFFIDEDSKQLQRISWICVGRYYCATTPSRKKCKTTNGSVGTCKWIAKKNSVWIIKLDSASVS